MKVSEIASTLQPLRQFGPNVVGSVDGDEKHLVLVLDLEQDGILSKSGKTFTVATTKGFTGVASGMRLNLTLSKALPAGFVAPNGNGGDGGDPEAGDGGGIGFDDED